MKINSKIYCDGYYTLNTMHHGKVYSITYSPGTRFDDAIKDFKYEIGKLIRENSTELPPNSSSDSVQNQKR